MEEIIKEILMSGVLVLVGFFGKTLLTKREKNKIDIDLNKDLIETIKLQAGTIKDFQTDYNNNIKIIKSKDSYIELLKLKIAELEIKYHEKQNPIISNLNNTTIVK